MKRGRNNNDTMSNTKIIGWVNTMKALSIIAVFFIHCQSYFDCVLPINKWITTWYVNAFFFVSGYLLFWKQLSAPRIDEDRKTYILMGG